jgi:DNA-binding transcriptional LysR family regulator
VLYEGAQDILRTWERTTSEVSSTVDSVAGVLRVGTIYSIGFYLLTPLVREFLKAHREVDLRVEYTHWNRIQAAVVSGEMDLGVVAHPEKHRSIEIIPLVEEELVVVCPPAHPLAERSEIQPRDLEDQDFIAFSANIPTRRNIDRLLKSHHTRVNVVMAFDNIETLKRSIEVGSGISILPRENVQREVADGHLAAIPFEDDHKWRRQISIIRRRGKNPSRAERLFLGMLRTAPKEKQLV